MKQEDLSADYQNLAIQHCRTLAAEGAASDPAIQQRTSLALMTILEADDTDLQHFESGEQFRVTFHKGTDAYKAEGAVVLQGVDKQPVGVKVEHVATVGQPVGNIARMGDEGGLCSKPRTGGEIADMLDPKRTRSSDFDAAGDASDAD